MRLFSAEGQHEEEEVFLFVVEEVAVLSGVARDDDDDGIDREECHGGEPIGTCEVREAGDGVSGSDWEAEALFDFHPFAKAIGEPDEWALGLGRAVRGGAAISGGVVAGDGGEVGGEGLASSMGLGAGRSVTREEFVEIENDSCGGGPGGVFDWVMFSGRRLADGEEGFC